MKIILSLLLALLFSNSYGQTSAADSFESWYNSQYYDKVINDVQFKRELLSAKALYYKAMAYYMKEDNNTAIKYFDSAIKKGPIHQDMYFYKGMALFYADKPSESLPYFDKAIAMLPNETDYLAGKGEAFRALQNADSAIFYFEKAAILPRCKPRVFMLLGEFYQDRNRLQDALEAYKTAYAVMKPSNKSYKNCSFNLGLMQQLTGNIASVRETFEKHAFSFPEDFHSMAKLVQIYYALAEFDRAKPLKAKLYAAHKENKLQNGLKDMFCFGQFIWEGKRVMAFEVFDEPEDVLFAKHHFYVLDENGKATYKVDSESSFAIPMNNSKDKYVLCLVKGQAHFTYWQYVFNDDYKYPDLKKAVLDILNDKVKPSASFIPGKSK